ncbi:MAG: acetyl-CoA carboxylase biotin carboxylase subunit [Gemmatimonadetes bacterium]|nr:acetyl-CoA carboxylase biotin carboxylase subunit [Gemmatimonadota bacterium]MYG85238.1 acetyl-CoA carboxylase biotin carboxylase subunit [Gemmatimonadota bacterium]MYJ88905.1 acetyl-CoA carboxylase biotin carboxylase subunit [Gemmatimonadota bacterium]
MFQKILIANRGEIALRVIRSCKELNIATLAVHSETDQDSLHVRFADEAVCIGSNAPNDSYLNIPRIISAAEIMNADAVHPGYGFLSENPHFAEVCESCDIAFIGPPSRAIRLMGDKAEARKTVAASDVPTIPGTEDVVEDEDAAVEASREIGFPLVIKASAGGGGRGIRIVRDEGELREAFRLASREAQNAFNNPALYLERYIEKARHIEVQVLGDRHGQVVHLGERDCSIQRRRQKLIEESPSPFVDDELRAGLGEAALRAARAIDYENAGTVEFLVTEDRQFYFMEMNTRIQVEHPVTEMVVSQDLVKEQIRVAAGHPLGFAQEDVQMRGHAIECRINAEDPDRNFMPSTGEITSFHTPGGYGVRVDSHVYAQYVVTPFYDSMLAKLIVWGKDREEAMTRTERALEEFIVEGINTTIPFHQFMLRHPTFRSGQADTDFVESLSSLS